MDAARAVFAANGIDGTSVDDICDAAGYSKGGFYFHFRSKDDLLLRLAQDAVSSGAGSLAPVAAWEWPQDLAIEFHTYASRRPHLRERLARQSAARLAQLRDAATSHWKTSVDADAAAELIHALEIGLQVQTRILPAEDQPRRVHEVIPALAGFPASLAAGRTKR